MLGTTWVGEFAATGAFEPTPEGLVDESSFFEGSWGTAVVDDVAYGVPWYVDTRVLYYRTDMAEAAGVEPPTTWDEYKAFAQAMKDQGATSGVSLPPGGFDSWQYVLPLVWQQGGDVMTEDGTAFAFDTPEWQEAFAFYASFFEEGLSEPVRLEGGEIEQKFISGEVGSFYSGPFHVSLLRDQGGAEFEDKFAVAMVPGADSRTSFTGGGNLAVFDDTDNRDASWKFVRWLSQPETQIEWYGISTDLPSVQSAFEDPIFADDPYLSVFAEQLRRLEGSAGDPHVGPGVGRDRPAARGGHPRRDHRRGRPRQPAVAGRVHRHGTVVTAMATLTSRSGRAEVAPSPTGGARLPTPSEPHDPHRVGVRRRRSSSCSSSSSRGRSSRASR